MHIKLLFLFVCLVFGLCSLYCIFNSSFIEACLSAKAKKDLLAYQTLKSFLWLDFLKHHLIRNQYVFFSFGKHYLNTSNIKCH